jgi:cobalt-zinc-cadmium resistance protein CzcA
VQTAFAGETAGQVFEQERRFDLVLRLRSDLRKDINSVRRLFIAGPNGRQVPLEQVANVELREGPNQIQRDDAKRRITVAFNVRGRDVATVVQELQGKIDRQIKFAPGYYTTYGGQFENLRQATDRLSIAVPVALALIFVLLFFTFGSLKQSVLIFTAIPLSAIGGIAALWLRGMPFSISAGVGFIALFGVAVLNGIVLIGYFNQLKAEGVADLMERIMRGTEVRLRPVLMTATVASLGFLPMALSTSAGAEVQRPLATVVIGGLVTSTLLTLLVLPVLYAWVELSRKPEAGSIEVGERNKSTEGRKVQANSIGKSSPFNLLMSTIFLLISCCCFPVHSAYAQGPLTEMRAVALALQANSTVQAAQRTLEAQQALRPTAFDVGRTSVLGNYGYYNSPQRDLAFSVDQTLALPGYYRAQRLPAGGVRPAPAADPARAG